MRDAGMVLQLFTQTMASLIDCLKHPEHWHTYCEQIMAALSLGNKQVHAQTELAGNQCIVLKNLHQLAGDVAFTVEALLASEREVMNPSVEG